MWKRGQIYNITGRASVGSYEGGITGPGGVPPRIPHFLSDNLIDPAKIQAVSQGGGLSQGGLVLLTDNVEHSYHLFTDPTTGSYAGCGSGTCRNVVATPAQDIDRTPQDKPDPLRQENRTRRPRDLRHEAAGGFFSKTGRNASQAFRRDCWAEGDVGISSCTNTHSERLTGRSPKKRRK